MMSSQQWAVLTVSQLLLVWSVTTWKGLRSSQGTCQVISSHKIIPNEYTFAALLKF